jgi:hypothetical protein
VRVIACLHGDTIQEVVRNPDYEPLLGIEDGQRVYPTIFTSAVELRERGFYYCYGTLSETVDDVLANKSPASKLLPLENLPTLRQNLLTANESQPDKPIEEVVAGVFQNYLSRHGGERLELQLLCKQGLSFLKGVRGENFNRA